jgi:Ulp1 family protease
MTVFKEVRCEDLERLKPGKWLNDNLVFAGLK